MKIENYNIFFDLDGTIFDSAKDIQNSWNEVLNKFGMNSVEIPIGPTIDEIISMYFNNLDSLSIKKYFKSVYDNSSMPNTIPYHGIIDAISRLKINNNLYILTNKRLIPTNFLLHKFNIYGMFNSIITSDSYSGLNNKSEIFKQYIKEFKIKQDTIIIVGDTFQDIKVALENRCIGIYCNWGYGSDNFKVPTIRIDLKDLINLN